MTRTEQAEQVLAALNPHYRAPWCCVFCGRRKAQFMASALNPDGDRKGVCSPCHRVKFKTVGRQYVGLLDVLKKVELGDFD